MGIFGGTPQDQVDANDLKDRVTRLEAAVASLQSQLATMATGVPYGAAAPLAPLAASAGAAMPMSPSLGVNGPATPGYDWMTEVRALKSSGQLITAIKLYREKTGVGLKEAKDAVEGMV